jgi:hypothetical protein
MKHQDYPPIPPEITLSYFQNVVNDVLAILDNYDEVPLTPDGLHSLIVYVVDIDLAGGEIADDFELTWDQMTIEMKVCAQRAMQATKDPETARKFINLVYNYLARRFF